MLEIRSTQFLTRAPRLMSVASREPGPATGHARTVLIVLVTFLLATVAAVATSGPASATCPPRAPDCGVHHPPPPEPTTPALAGLTSVSSTSASTTISWTDAMTDESSYQVDWSVHSTYLTPGTHDVVPVYTGPITVPAKAGTSTYTWTHENLWPGQTWTYTVWAVRNGVRGASQTVTTTTVPVAPAAPSFRICDSNLPRVDPVNPGVDVCWTPGTVPLHGVPPNRYDVQRRTPSGSTWSTIMAGSGGPTETDEAVTYGSTWCWRVVAFNPGGQTPSNQACYTVPARAPVVTDLYMSAWNGVVTGSWDSDGAAESYDFFVTDYHQTWDHVLPRGTRSDRISGISCGNQGYGEVLPSRPGTYPAATVSASFTMRCDTAPGVTHLSGAVSGTSIIWTWDGHASDRDYTVTLADSTTWSDYPPKVVAGRHDGTVTFKSDNLTAGHTYQVYVVTHRDFNWDSPGVIARTQFGTADSGVKEVDVYNCSAAGNRTIWMSTGGAFTNVGVAQDVVGLPCGPGASLPLKVTLPNAIVTLESTDDGLPPQGVDNVRYTQVFSGSGNGIVVAALLST